MTLKLHDTLSGETKEFVPLSPHEVTMYNCGPTVYNYPHIGNMRAFLLADIVRRTLELNAYKVRQVMNITDVGHIVADADTGEDKMEKTAREKGTTAKEISEFYTKAFFEDLRLMNIESAEMYPKATEHIPEQIALIQKLEEKGFTYKTSDGIYFDTSLFPAYGKLGNVNLKGLEEGARVEKNVERKNLTDFALWKFSKPEDKRQQEWDSPWGIGFPGWHIECSAMSMKYLGETFDIHTGGIDHIPVHHNNEIAQSESATGKPYANYWLHNEHVNIEGGKMAKSEGNFLRIQTLIDKKIHPLSYRYYLLGAHYKTPMNFSFEAVLGAQAGFEKVLHEIANFIRSGEKGDASKEYLEKFQNFINDDLDTPKGLALLHEVLASKISSAKKLATIIGFDKVFGLDLLKLAKKMVEIPKDVAEKNEKREAERAGKNFAHADALRKEIEDAGFNVYDSTQGSMIEKKLSSLTGTA